MLEVYYAVTNETFFAGVKRAADPMGMVRKGATMQGDHKLVEAHAALMEAIQPLLKEQGIEPEALINNQLIIKNKSVR